MKTLLALVALVAIMSISSCQKDCYVDPELEIPDTVNNIVLKESSPGATYVGSDFYPWGIAPIFVYGSKNLFYSVVRTDPFSGMPVTFYWSESVSSAFSPFGQAPFHPVQDGELLTCYIAVLNKKDPSLSCIFKEAKKVESIIDVITKVQDRQVVQTKQVKQTRYDVPAGKYAVFDFPIEYNENYRYQLNLAVDLDGNLVSTDTLVIDKLPQ